MDASESGKVIWTNHCPENNLQVEISGNCQWPRPVCLRKISPRAERKMLREVYKKPRNSSQDLQLASITIDAYHYKKAVKMNTAMVVCERKPSRQDYNLPINI